MTGNFHRRIDKLDNRIEERNIVASKDREPLTSKQIARILNWVRMQGLQPNATPLQREKSRLIDNLITNGFKLTENERALLRSR